MKKVVLLFALSILYVSSFAQEIKSDSLQIDSKKENKDPSFEERVMKVLDMIRREKRFSAEKAYKLYPTKNIWTFLKLDTRSGVISQVQFSTSGSEYRFETYLNSQMLIDSFDDYKIGRFELYPTENTYNFILLDQENGQCWQVQWGKKEERQVIRIR